ncbi:MAG: cobalamin B12-binding domain-containing protein [Chloroflexi bacterium]|nr:cobalamin B12-binding domain-containing protein [Chloroflexota bacterium]
MVKVEGRKVAKGQRIRVLMAKPGLDGHDRGAKIMTLGLRDTGFEVIYTGIRQTPEKIARAAIQEDVDVVGLSCLSGAHNYLFPRVVELLKENDRGDVLVIGGGLIPPEDVKPLKARGISAIFTYGATIGEVSDYIKKELRTRRTRREQLHSGAKGGRGVSKRKAG